MTQPDETDFERRYRSSLRRERQRAEKEYGEERDEAAALTGIGAAVGLIAGVFVGLPGVDLQSVLDRAAGAGVGAIVGALVGLRLVSFLRDD